MRLFLTSSNLGKFPETLVEMVGDNKKALLITNARDHRSEEDRKTVVEHDAQRLVDCGFDVTELDLRKYINNQAALKEYIKEFDPGLIFAIGGNVYSLATTMHFSGMDEILREDLSEDKYVYGGYSAGAMVASHDLLSYLDSFGEQPDDDLEQTKEIYGEVTTDGLGLIEEYVIPHADEEEFKVICKKAETAVLNRGLTPVVLNDADVMVFDNGKTEVKRYE